MVLVRLWSEDICSPASKAMSDREKLVKHQCDMKEQRILKLTKMVNRMSLTQGVSLKVCWMLRTWKRKKEKKVAHQSSSDLHEQARWQAWKRLQQYHQYLIAMLWHRWTSSSLQPVLIFQSRTDCCQTAMNCLRYMSSSCPQWCCLHHLRPYVAMWRFCLLLLPHDLSFHISSTTLFNTWFINQRAKIYR